MSEHKGYPAYMHESLDKVADTRDERINNLSTIYENLKMTLDERNQILEENHPDYQPTGKRKLKIGPSTGELVPNELADILEAHPLISEEEIDLSIIDYDCDILVIGGGGAGTVASLWAVNEGIDPSRILMVTKLRHGDSNSMMAQGGIQGATSKNDSPTRHYLDAMGGGHFTNNPMLVEALTKDAPLIIQWLENLGVIFDRNEDNTFSLLPGGGTSCNRMHSAKDYTGMEIMRVLRDEFRNKNIPVIEFSPAIELIKNDSGSVAGAVVLNLETQQYNVIRAKSVVMASGGFGRLHIQGYSTTNHYGATADGLVMAYRVGVPLVDMDSVQYHPTGAAFPQQIKGCLVTEKVRGLGAMPVNSEGNAFVYPLEPRDVEASALIRECYKRNLGVTTPTGFRGVWLDSPMIEILKGEGTIKRELNAMWRMFSKFGIDMTKDPILVFPTLHYQNGGMIIDENGATKIPGLYAGGETEGGVHGKNRLMGNSLLDYNVFGRRAGISAAQHAKRIKKNGKLTLQHLGAYEDLMKKANINTERKSPVILPDYRNEEIINRMIPHIKI